MAVTVNSRELRVTYSAAQLLMFGALLRWRQQECCRPFTAVYYPAFLELAQWYWRRSSLNFGY